MKIKFKRSVILSKGKTGEAGKTEDVDDKTALRLIANGAAEPAPAKKKRAKKAEDD